MSVGFKWNEAEMTMKEFVEKFRHCLPVLCVTTSGYSGCDEDMHQIGAGEVYWIFEIQRQKRIVARPKDAFDCYICIPIDYPLRVQIIDSSTGTVGTSVPIVDVDERLADGSESVYFQFESNRSVPFLSGACMQKTAQLGELRVEDTYEEKYLLAYSICGGRICSKSIAIPVYLDITLSTCQQLTQTPKRQEYEQWMNKVKDITRTFQNNSIKMCKEIIAFNQTPSGGDYEYLNPSLLIGSKNSFLMSSSSSSEDKNSKNAKNGDGKHLNSRIQNDYDGFSRQPKRRESPAAHTTSSSELSFPLPAFPGSSPSFPIESGRSEQEKEDEEEEDSKTKKRSAAKKAAPPPPPPKAALPRPGSPGNQSPAASLLSGTGSEGGSAPDSRRPPPPPPPPSSSHRVTANAMADPPPSPPTLPPPANRCVTTDVFPPDADMASLTVEDVGALLRLLKMDDHSDCFEQRQIDGPLLRRITEDSLRNEFGLSGFEAKKLTMFVHEGWRPKKRK